MAGYTSDVGFDDTECNFEWLNDKTTEKYSMLEVFKFRFKFKQTNLN